jgi:hypothetical protein
MHQNSLFSGTQAEKTWKSEKKNCEIILSEKRPLYASVTLCRFGFPIRPDLKIGVDRGSVWVSRSKVWTGRG